MSRTLRVGMVVAMMMAGRTHAQAPSDAAELRGRVHIAGDTMSVDGASIEAQGLGVSAVARRDGGYRLAGLRVGRVTLVVRRIGLASRTVEVEIVEPGVLRYDIAMSRLPNALSEVRINGRMRSVPVGMEDVFRRMGHAHGTFFLAEDMVQMNPIDLFAVVQRVRGVRVNDTAITVPKCTNAGANAGESGKVQIWIDGMRMTRYFREEEQREVLSRVSPAAVKAIEVYTSMSSIPGEFLDDACAVILIWTK